MTIENPRNLTPDELEREHWILGNRIQAEVYGTVSDLEAELNGVEKIASDTQENIQRALSNIDEARLHIDGLTAELHHAQDVIIRLSLSRNELRQITAIFNIIRDRVNNTRNSLIFAKSALE